MSQVHEAARRAHPETYSTGVVRPGHDGVPVLVTTSSSNVHAVGFADGALFVRFANGSVYRYTAKESPAVPDAAADVAALHAGLMAAASKGSYLSQHLRRNAAVDCVYLGRCFDPVASVEHHENGDGC